jgi:hypothetical protein
MTTEIIKTCFVCGEAGNLIPLYTERAPTAQPVAYIHTECLSEWRDTTSEEDEALDPSDKAKP